MFIKSSRNFLWWSSRLLKLIKKIGAVLTIFIIRVESNPVVEPDEPYDNPVIYCLGQIFNILKICFKDLNHVSVVYHYLTLFAAHQTKLSILLYFLSDPEPIYVNPSINRSEQICFVNQNLILNWLVEKNEHEREHDFEKPLKLHYAFKVI